MRELFKMKNIKNLSDDQLFIQYQEARKNLLAAEVGSQEEMDLDELFSELSKEVDNRNIDLKAYKLEDKEQYQQIKQNNVLYEDKTLILHTLRKECEIAKVNIKESKSIIFKLAIALVIGIVSIFNSVPGHAESSTGAAIGIID
jgi:hypothetical protein